MQQPVVLQQLRDTLFAEYDVELDRLDQDLTDLINRLASEGLVEIRDEPAR
jgi:hypothetical protein